MAVEIGFRFGVLAAATLAALLLVIFVSGGDATRFAWRENGPIESISALSYLIGAALCFYFYARSVRPIRWYFALWGVLCIVFFGEETSWLQHQLGFETPDAIADRNAQREFNLHNLNILHGGALLAGESTSWKTLFKSQHLFQLGFFAYFLLLPVAAHVPPTRGLIARLQIPYPGPVFVVSIWLTIALSVALTALSSPETKPAIAESREMIYALSILAFVGSYACRIFRPASKRAVHDPSVPPGTRR